VDSISAENVVTHAHLAFRSCAAPVGLDLTVLVAAVSVKDVAVVALLCAQTRVIPAVSTTRLCNDDSLLDDFLSQVHDNNLHFAEAQVIDRVSQRAGLEADCLVAAELDLVGVKI